MNDPRELIATMERTGAPAVLATLLRRAADGPGPVRRRLLDSAPAPLGEPVLEVLASGRSRILALEPGPLLDLLGGAGDGVQVLLERLLPGKLPPWLHCSAQTLRRGGACVLATVIAQAGDVPAAAGDRFVYDERNHGLLPMDGRFSLELQRACDRARAAGQPVWERFSQPGGSLQVGLEPWPAVPSA